MPNRNQDAPNWNTSTLGGRNKAQSFVQMVGKGWPNTRVNTIYYIGKLEQKKGPHRNIAAKVAYLEKVE